MIKNENIICISSIDWDFNWQGHQEIMSAFAKNGNRVLFLENTGVRAPGVRDIKRIKSRLKNWSKGVKGIRKIADNLYVLSPLLLPFPYMKIARWINRRLILSTLSKWISLTNFDDLIVWAFLPTPLSLDIIEDLPKKIVVYYCIDDLKSSSKTANKIEAYEIRLLKRADFVFVTSGALYEYSSSFNRNVYLFPFAVNFQQFEKARLDPEGACGITSGFKKPVIGYVGGINVKTDQALIRKMAQECPDYSFVFAGPLETDTSAFSGIKNVYLLGNQKHRDVPYLIKSFDVCVIPYVISEYTKSVYPAKLNEYHSMGKPVVSTALPEILFFNHKNDSLVFVGRNHKEFIDKIQKALDTVDNEELVKARIDSARANSWLKRIDDMSALLENKIRKDSDSGKDWMGSFSGFYRNLRVKFLRACFIAAGIYLFVFCTPLAWWLANPLVIADRPQKADCIVVFAGGVGESGRAGQGYEERVLYAAELYKKDYAKKILFSSGYTYVFKEPQVMKALAVSLGVPQEVIILEDSAKNTYENVRFTKSILDNRQWRKILLVSSPYHMKRASLVFRKIAKNIDVRYTPIPSSHFYTRDASQRKWAWQQINLEQIRGIIHEYLGILYYWGKGWI